MQFLTLAGIVGKDAILRTTDRGDDVLNFSLAVDNGKDKLGDKRSPTWFDCSMWGERARKLQPHVKKGSRLALSGRPSARAHDGKAYLGITVDGLTFMGGGDQSGRAGGGSEPQQGAGVRESYDLNDDIPF